MGSRPLIDFILINLAWYGLPWIWYLVGPSDWINHYGYGWLYVTVLVISVVYLIGMRMTDRGTLGYRIMRIQYAYAFDRKPELLDRAYRALLAVVLLWAFVFDHLWILFDERKQAWHDKVSGFYVVKRGATPIGSATMGRRMINFMMLSFPVIEPIDDKSDTFAIMG